MSVIGVDFSGKFPDTPPCYCVAVRNSEKTLRVSSIGVGHISEPAIEKADKLSKAFRRTGHYDVKDPSILEFVRMIHPARGACFTP